MFDTISKICSGAVVSSWQLLRSDNGTFVIWCCCGGDTVARVVWWFGQQYCSDHGPGVIVALSLFVTYSYIDVIMLLSWCWCDNGTAVRRILSHQPSCCDQGIPIILVPALIMIFFVTRSRLTWSMMAVHAMEWSSFLYFWRIKDRSCMLTTKCTKVERYRGWLTTFHVVSSNLRPRQNLTSFAERKKESLAVAAGFGYQWSSFERKNQQNGIATSVSLKQ